MDEGFGYHDTRAGHGNARGNTGRLPALDGTEHHLSSHRDGWAAGIPRHALGQRYLASGGVGRKGASGFAGVVHISFQVEAVQQFIDKQALPRLSTFLKSPSEKSLSPMRNNF